MPFTFEAEALPSIQHTPHNFERLLWHPRYLSLMGENQPPLNYADEMWVESYTHVETWQGHGRRPMGGESCFTCN